MKKLRFLVSLTTRENDYQLEQAAAAQDAARRLGADLDILYADNDAITQSTQILKAVQAAPQLRPDAIVFEPVGATSLPQVARFEVFHNLLAAAKFTLRRVENDFRIKTIQ